MRFKLVLFAAAAMTASVVQARNQSSNTSFNRLSNNGVVRESIADTYYKYEHREPFVQHRVYSNIRRYERHRDR